MALRQDRQGRQDHPLVVEFAATVEAVPLIQGFEQLGAAFGRFGAAEEQAAPRAQGIVKRGKHVLLGRPLQVDQEVAADDQVELGKGRVLQQVMRGKEDQVAHLRPHLVVAVLVHEEARQARRGHVGGDGFRIDAFARKVQRQLAQVGGKDLDMRRPVELAGIFQEQHGGAVGFFSGGAAHGPHAHAIAGAFALKQLGYDLLRQHRPRCGVAEELGDMDEHVVVEGVDLGAVLAQAEEVIGQRLQVEQLHAAGDAAQEGRFLIAAKVVPRAHAQLGQDLEEGLPVALGEVLWFRRQREGGLRAFRRHQLGGQLGDGGDDVHQPGGDGAFGHAVVLGFVRRLDQQEAAVLLDRAHADGAVAAACPRG